MYIFGKHDQPPKYSSPTLTCLRSADDNAKYPLNLKKLSGASDWSVHKRYDSIQFFNFLSAIVSQYNTWDMICQVLFFVKFFYQSINKFFYIIFSAISIKKTITLCIIKTHLH